MVQSVRFSRDKSFPLCPPTRSCLYMEEKDTHWVHSMSMHASCPLRQLDSCLLNVYAQLNIWFPL